MKMSIRTRILLLVLSGALATLLAAGGISLYAFFAARQVMAERENAMGEELAQYMGSSVEQNAKARLLELVEAQAQNIDRELTGIKEDVEYMSAGMSMILQRPRLYRPRPLTVTDPEEDILSGTPYVHYAPGVSAREDGLGEEVALAGNFADLLEVISGSYYGYHSSFFAGSRKGYLIALDIVSTGEGTGGSIYPSPEEKADFVMNYDNRLRPWYLLGQKTDKATFTEPYVGADGLASATCVMPYYDADGFAGVVGISFSADDLQKMSEDFALHRESMIFALDKNGSIQMSSDKEGALAVTPGHADLRQAAAPDLAEAARRMTAGESGVMNVDLSGQGDISYLAFAPMTNIGWSLGVLIEDDAVLEPVEHATAAVRDHSAALMETLNGIFAGALTRTALVLIPVLCLLLYAAGFLSARLTRPIKELEQGVEEIANGNFDKKLAFPAGDEIGHLADCYDAMTEKLKEYTKHLEQAAAERERIRTEMELAARIQADMLPRLLPERPEFDLCAAIYPAKNVGGDFYDFYFADERHLVITIADVSGKGVPAALFMAAAKTVLRNCFLAEGNPEQVAAVLEKAGRQLCLNNDAAMFVTVFLGVLDLDTGRFTYADGGHCWPFWRHGRIYGFLPVEKGAMLGLMELSYRQQSVDLAPGDTLFLYTDGVSEAMDEQGQLFTEPRIHETLNALPPEGDASDILSAMLKAVQRHTGNAEQSDDITMLALRYL